MESSDIELTILHNLGMTFTFPVGFMVHANTYRKPFQKSSIKYTHPYNDKKSRY